MGVFTFEVPLVEYREKKLFWARGLAGLALGGADSVRSSKGSELGFGPPSLAFLPQNVKGENEITSPALVFPVLGP
jgi:hypothetical protein